MDDGPAGHAMTEIALALAMSFFCLLVLALVSVGVPPAADPAAALALAPDVPPDRPPAETSAGTPAADAFLVVFHRGRFLDRDRRPLAPESLAGVGRVMLAVDPALPMAEALAARARIAAADLMVTPLDAAWLAALGTGDVR